MAKSNNQYGSKINRDEFGDKELCNIEEI